MFDIEKAIEEWRWQMAAGGVRKPDVLDELEGHLREEVERRMRAGLDAALAWQEAVERIGPIDVLRPEFSKVRRILGMDKIQKTHRILGILWCLICLGLLNEACHSPPSGPSKGDAVARGLWMTAIFIYAVGAVGSASLFRGATWGRYMARTFALLMMIAFLGQMLVSGTTVGGRWWLGAVAVFCLVSIRLLHIPAYAKMNPDRKGQYV